MISTKKLLYVTIGALLLAAVSQWLGQSRDSSPDQRVGQPLIQVDLVDQMDGLTIQRGKVILEMKRIGAHWKILSKGGFPVNESKLISLMQKMGNSRINSLVSSSPARKADFGLLDPASNPAETSGVSLIFYEGTHKLTHLILGTSRGGGHGQGGQYITYQGDPNSYLIQQNLELLYMAQDWMQTRLWSFPTDAIQAVQWEDGTNLQLARETPEGAFISVSGKKVPIPVMAGILKNISSLSILDSFSPPDLANKPLKKKGKLLITLFEGQALAMEIWEWADEEEQRFFIKILPAPNEGTAKAFEDLFALAPHWLFEVADWQLEGLIKLAKEKI